MIKLNEFLPYFIIGGTATVIDWSIFWSAITYGHFNYMAALVLAYVLAGIFHYISNKIITFKCRSKQIGSQYSLYILVTTSSLVLSLGILAGFIHGFAMSPMSARILTTLLMLVPNYLLHKYITFSKRVFQQPVNPLS